MLKVIKFLFKWLPAICTTIRELFKLVQDYRKHRIQMRTLKADLEKVKEEAIEEHPPATTQREPP